MTTEDYKKLLDSLENEDERKIIKILLENTMPEMVNYFQEKVEELRAGILAEEISEVNRWEIAVTVCEKDRVGSMEEGFYPMKLKDTEKEHAVRQGQFVFFPIFLEAEDGEISERLESYFAGKLTVDDEEIEVPVQLKRNDSYHETVRQLKQSFIASGIKWVPVNSAYLDKFYYFVAELPEEMQDGKESSHYSLQLKDFDLKVKEEIIPIWNVEHITVTASDFPVIQEDKMLYQYEFRVGDGAEFIPDHQMQVDGECARRGDFLLVLTQENDRNQFTFWKLTKRDWSQLKTEHLILTNGTKKMLAGRQPDCSIVHSPFELERAVYQLPVSQYVKFTGFRVKPSDYYEHCESAFDVIKARKDGDLIAQIRQRDYLELEFENVSMDDYLFRNVLQYVADVVQAEFREFQVVIAPAEDT